QGLIVTAGPIQVSGALRRRGKLQGLGEERHQVTFGIAHGIAPTWYPEISARSGGTRRQDFFGIVVRTEGGVTRRSAPATARPGQRPTGDRRSLPRCRVRKRPRPA